MYEIKLKDTGQVIEAKNRKLVHYSNKASVLTFSLMFNSKFINSLEKHITRITVTDDSNNLEFNGYVVDISEKMDSNGNINKEVTCFSVLDYLNSVNVGKWDIHPGTYVPDKDEKAEVTNEIAKYNDELTKKQAELASETDAERRKTLQESINSINENITKKNQELFKLNNTEDTVIYENYDVQKYLKLIIDTHNNNISNENKKIYLRNVDIADSVYCTTNRGKCLSAIQSLVSSKGGFITVEEVDDKNYLDYFHEVAEAENTIELGVNMKTLERNSNLENIVTRIIPLGADGIGIANVNGGLNYVQDDELVAKYGVISEVVQWDDVTEPTNLLAKAQEKMKKINDETYSVDVNSLDLSYIISNFNKFKINQFVEIKNKLLNIDEKYRIIQISIDLDNPYNSELTFSNSMSSLVSSSADTSKRISNTENNIEVINDKISRKVSRDGVECIVTQKADSWGISINGKLKGTYYNFDGDNFTIGDSNGLTTAFHNNERSRWQHKTDGYSEANYQGFFRNGRPYHCLMEIGSAIVGGSAGAYPSIATIQLPDTWKGRSFDVQVQMVDTAGGVEDEVVKRTYLEVTEINTTDGTFKVRGYWTAINTSTKEENEKELHFSYIVVGG